MKFLMQFFVIVFMLQALASAEQTAAPDIPAEAAAQFAAAERLKEQNQLEQSQQVYGDLWKKYPNNFSIAHGYGRLLAQMKQYEKSVEMLQAALKIGEAQKVFPDLSLYNTIGFVCIMQGDFDQALEYFKASAAPEIYNNLSDATKMKLHNNTGYAMMLADRYEESLREFEQAKQLGSSKAVENIEKVKSLIETQEKQNPDLPGIFAVVIHSTKNEDQIDDIISRLMKDIQSSLPADKQQDLDKPAVYLAKNGMYFIALASNSSYAKAQKLLTAVRKVVKDAFVSSTTSWEPYQVAGERLPSLKEALMPVNDKGGK